MDFYRDTCPQAEEVIREQVKLLYKRHKNTAFSWLRNIFHDCAILSCDASLLLDSTRRSLSENEMDKSFGMRNFKYIEEIKEALERECPGVVSCSNILVLSAREGVVKKSLLKEAQDDPTTQFLLCSNFEDEEKNTPVKPLLPRVSSYTTTSAAAPNNHQQRRRRTASDSSISSHFDEGSHHTLACDVEHAAAETFLVTRLILKLLKYLGDPKKAKEKENMLLQMVSSCFYKAIK
ncbi:hypothetical protein ACFX12_003741 [Malus domestica]